MTGSYADRHNTLPCMGSHPVQRTANARRPTMKEMGVDHRQVRPGDPSLSHAFPRSIFREATSVASTARIERGPPHSSPSPEGGGQTVLHCAHRGIQYYVPSKILLFILTESSTHAGLTAPVERGSSEAARSGSKRLAWVLLSFPFLRAR